MPGSFRLMANNMLLKDEPDHRRLRKLVDQAFQRRHVRDMRGDIERLADRLLDDFEGRAEVDLVSLFLRRLPLAVICELLGLPDQDRQIFSMWTKSATSIRSTFASSA
jgi:cytochrome P450